MRLHLRADDGIRTRDPHLGKVMRYQLRYIRAPRARSSPRANRNDSPPQYGRTNLPAAFASRRQLSVFWPKSPVVLLFDVVRLPASDWHAGPVAQWESVRFTRGRSLVRSQPGPPRFVKVSCCLVGAGQRSRLHLTAKIRPRLIFRSSSGRLPAEPHHTRHAAHRRGPDAVESGLGDGACRAHNPERRRFESCPATKVSGLGQARRLPA